MTINNALYEELADTWWHENSFLSVLQMLNPVRFKYLLAVLNEEKIKLGGKTILDVGCGGGFTCEEFAKQGARVSGVDPSHTTIKVADQHSKAMGFDITYKVGIGEALPFNDSTFDLVSCCDVLEHVQDLGAVIREVNRVLKPGGIFFYDTINRTFISWLLMIKVAQDLPFRMLPKDLHVWSVFIKPRELEQLMTQSGLSSQHFTGYRPRLNISTLLQAAKEIKVRLGRVDPYQMENFIHMHPSRFTQVHYMGWARKEA